MIARASGILRSKKQTVVAFFQRGLVDKAGFLVVFNEQNGWPSRLRGVVGCGCERLILQDLP